MRRLIVTLVLSLFAVPGLAVVGGEVVDWDETGSVWGGVVAITPEGGGTYSGVLIDERHVLTAAHVVFRNRFAPGRIRLRFNLPQEGVVVVPAEAVHIHPDYLSGNTARDDSFGWHDDLALVRLAGVAPESVHPFPLTTKPPSGNTTFSFAGYGAVADPTTGAVTVKPDPGILRRGHNRIEKLLADDEGSGRDEMLLFTYDAPPARSQVFRGPRPASRWVPGEAQLAFGDSGCPLFLEMEGQPEVLAIAAFNGSTPASCDKDAAGKPAHCSKTRYGALAGATLVAPHLDWVRAILAGRMEPDP